jgi:hypothetical protein
MKRQSAFRMTNKTEYDTLLKYNFISEQLTKFFGISQYALCVFGTLMNILTFAQQNYTRRPCSLYLLGASIFDLIYLNLSSLSNILQYGFRYHWTTSLLYCKSQNYLVFVSAMISATLTTLAAINRFLLSSRNINRWKYSTRPFVLRSIPFVVIFWLLVSIPVNICATRFGHVSNNEEMICSNHCRDAFCLSIHVIYTCLINGLIPPLLILIFGLLTRRNVRDSHQRATSNRAHHTNRQLTSMIIFQSLKSSVSSFPLAIFNFYLILTMNLNKSAVHHAKENLINQVFYLLFWGNYTSFFIYLYSSDIFRNQWIKTIKKLGCCFHERRYYYSQTQSRKSRTTKASLIL